jgi:hypothetical protein
MRRDRRADVEGALQRLGGEIDDGDAAVGALVFTEDAAAIDRGIDRVPVARAHHLVGGARHDDFGLQRERGRVEELHLVGALAGHDEVGSAGAIVGVGGHATSCPGCGAA